MYFYGNKIVLVTIVKARNLFHRKIYLLKIYIYIYKEKKYANQLPKTTCQTSCSTHLLLYYQIHGGPFSRIMPAYHFSPATGASNWALHTAHMALVFNLTQRTLHLLGKSGGVVNSLDYCPALLKSLGCFYFRCVLSSQWKAVTVNLQILHCQR